MLSIAAADTLPATPEELQSAGRMVTSESSENGYSQKGISMITPPSPVPSVTSLGSQKEDSVLWHKHLKYVFFLSLGHLKI